MPKLPNLIEISHVGKRYRGAERDAVEDVSLNIGQGEIFGLLGPNGAGKTTLISILLGLVRKDRGSVRIDGHDMDRSLPQIRRLCGLAPQDLGFYPMLSVVENLRFFGAAGGLSGAALAQRVDFAVDTAQLDEHRRKHARVLSGGLKRRLNLALSLLHAPKILVLDEPTVGVDPQSRAFILDVIGRLRREQGLTVVYTSHYMEEVQQICDRVAIVDRGRVLTEGSMQELLGAPAAEGCRDLEDLFLRLTHHRLRD
ncbi:MAG TPA: ABC transporter ATP-binding protein [Verrucomicrobiae bacterium]|nr:ABC transporter ATP-binding protein [Verrucomicrobiae bacterium]